MGQAEQSIQCVCGLTELKQVRDWENRPVEFKPCYETLLPKNLGMHCREWPAGKANAEVQTLVEANSKPYDIMIYTDGSVARDRSGWGLTVKQGGRTVYEDGAAHRVRTSSLTMEVEAVTHAIQRLASQRDAQITHSIIPTDSINLLQRRSLEWAAPTSTQPCTVFDCKDLCESTALGILKSVGMNGQIDWQAQQMSHLVCSLAGQRCSEAWGTFWIWTGQSITALITWRKKKRVEKGRGRHSTLRGWEWSVFNQTNIGTVSRATLGRLRGDGAECVRAFSSATMPSWAETEAEILFHGPCRVQCPPRGSFTTSPEVRFPLSLWVFFGVESYHWLKNFPTSTQVQHVYFCPYLVSTPLLP